VPEPDASAEVGANGGVGAAGARGGEAGTTPGHAGEAGATGDTGGEGGGTGYCRYDMGGEFGGPYCFADCNGTQVDFWNWQTCGSCDVQCKVGAEDCTAGRCRPEHCLPGSASCTEPGCGSDISVPTDCGGCGVMAHPRAHAVALCTCNGECPVGICESGYANCDHTSSDCETPVAEGACVPHGPTGWCEAPFLDYTGRVVDAKIALAGDGSLFIYGNFYKDHDFDPTAGVDVHVAAGTYDTFVTKLNADGSYAWTTTWPSTQTNALLAGGLAAAADGSIIGDGVFFGSYDLDPGPGVDLAGDASDQHERAALFKLNADGSFAWARSWDPDVHPEALALDGADRIYVAGHFLGQMDADPGPGTTNLADAAAPGTKFADFLLSLDEQGNLRWAHSTTRARCTSFLHGLAVSGTELWAVGTLGSTGVNDCQGQTTDPQIELSGPSTTMFLRADLNGVVDRGLSLVGDSGPNNYYGAYSVAIGSAGSVYVGGNFAGQLDFDPASGAVLRSGRGPYVLSLSGNGAFRWVHAGSGMEGLVNATANDGVVAVGPDKLIKWASDGTPDFTLDLSRWRKPQVASNASALVIIGENKDTCVGGLALERYTW